MNAGGLGCAHKFLKSTKIGKARNGSYGGKRINIALRVPEVLFVQ